MEMEILRNRINVKLASNNNKKNKKKQKKTLFKMDIKTKQHVTKNI